jgi:hypothetical protein
MARIRRDLHDDVRGAVQNAEAATDWKRYIRAYPWASLGVAFAVGYLVVPRRHRPSTVIQAAPSEIQRVVEVARPAAEEKKKGLVMTVFGLVAPVALRAAQGYALQFFEQWMTQKLAAEAQRHPDLAAMMANLAGGSGGVDPSGPQPDPRGPGVRPPGSPRF